MSDEFTAFSNWVLTDFFFLLCGSSPFDRLRFVFFGGGWCLSGGGKVVEGGDGGWGSGCGDSYLA